MDKIVSSPVLYIVKPRLPTPFEFTSYRLSMSSDTNFSAVISIWCFYREKNMATAQLQRESNCWETLAILLIANFTKTFQYDVAQ